MTIQEAKNDSRKKKIVVKVGRDACGVDINCIP